MSAAAFSLSASLFRAYGGHLSDRFGARAVMYWTFGFSLALLFMLSYPPTDYVVLGKDGPIAFSTEMGQWPFVITLFVLGFFMSLGKAAVFKHIPVYYPDHVGAVGGLVGMIGGLGGFVLPISFGALLDLTGIYTSCFALLFVIVAISLTWMHLSVRAMERAAHGPALERLPQLPEMQDIHDPDKVAQTRVLQEWKPEDQTFWESKGRRIARRNLWISIPALLLAFSVWMVWSVVVARLLRQSVLTSPRVNCSGWRPCRACRVRPCGSSTASWCRFSAAGCGRHCRPSRCCCRPWASAMRCKIRRLPI